jgi:hypothetical protein
VASLEQLDAVLDMGQVLAQELEVLVVLVVLVGKQSSNSPSNNCRHRLDNLTRTPMSNHNRIRHDLSSASDQYCWSHFLCSNDVP